MNTVAIVQARMGSTRLPGKVLKPLCGDSVLSRVLERLKAVPSIDAIVVATTTSIEDDLIVEEAKANEVHIYRGSEKNVLSRYYEAAELYGADGIVRVTSDCPLIDPEITEEVIKTFYKMEVDYMSNKTTPTFPRGLDIEVFTRDALEISYRNAYNDIHTEHVTPYIYLHPEQFTISEYNSPVDYSRYRWTLDTEEDYKLITEIYNYLHQPDKIFGWRQVIALMERIPDLPLINQHIEQKKLGE